MAINWGATRWLTAGILFTILFVLVAIIMGLLLGVTKDAVFCDAFKTDTVGTGQGEMQEVLKASLFPYTGGWDHREFGKSVNECVDICLSDTFGPCKAFYRENENSAPANQGTCYFYSNNNVQQLVGADVDIDLFFTGTSMIVGAELPETHSDVYVKTGQAWKMFRSGFDDPGVVS
jgi:hypothetical protein